MFPDTKQFIFDEIGQRIRAHKKTEGLTYYQLAGYIDKPDYESRLKGSETTASERENRYGTFDYSIINNIANGKAHPKKNPYLISSNLIAHLSSKLNFKDPLELLFGDYQNNGFPEQLFKHLLTDILFNGKQSEKDILNAVLMDFVPYAEYHSYWQMFLSNEIPMPKIKNTNYIKPSFLYGISQDETFDGHAKSRSQAIQVLYLKHQDYLSVTIKLFLEKDFNVDGVYTLKKLDSKLQLLVDKLLEFFRTHLPNETSLGIRVRNILLSDFKTMGYLNEKTISEEKLDLPDLTDKYLVQASLNYIAELKRVQILQLNAIKGYHFLDK